MGCNASKACEITPNTSKASTPNSYVSRDEGENTHRKAQVMLSTEKHINFLVESGELVAGEFEVVKPSLDEEKYMAFMDDLENPKKNALVDSRSKLVIEDIHVECSKC